MSITNPSVQGIASLYRGNPAALQANIQKDQQANPSLPPDLTKALALNIDLNEQDASKKQMALQQLQQLQAQGGKPPTIMQKLEQQAQMKQQQEQMMKQALQARMQQAQAQQAQQPQQPMGIAAALPQEAPQGEAQGIDQAPTNLQMASGGIVAFDDGGRGADKAEYTEADLEKQRKEDREKLAQLTKYLGETGGEFAGKGLAAAADVLSLIPRGVAGAVDTALIRPARALGADVGYLSPELTPGNQNPDTMTPFYDRYIRAKEQQGDVPQQAPAQAAPVSPGVGAGAGRGSQGGPTAEQFVPPPKAPANQGIPQALAAPAAQRRAPQEAPAPASAPVDPMVKQYNDLIAQAMKRTPDEARAEAAARYDKEVGKADMTPYEETLKELAARREQLKGPEKGIDSLLNYLGHIATQGQRGESWMASGARGAAAQKAETKLRQEEDFGVLKEILNTKVKMGEITRADKKDRFNSIEKEADEAYTRAYNAATEAGKDIREREKIAAEAKQRVLDRATQLEAARIQAAPRPGETQQILAEYTRILKEEGKPAADAYMERVRDVVSVRDGGVKQAALETKIQAEIDKRTKLIDMRLQSTKDPKEIAALTTRRKEIEDEVRKHYASPATGKTSTPEAKDGTVRMRFDAQGNPI